MKLAVKKTRKPAVRAAKPKLARPALTLKADKLSVATEGTIAVRVDFKGCDSVALSVEPKRAFGIDLKALTRSGLVRLRGKRDGKATLIASGRVGSEEVVQKMLHVACEGAQLRILGWGYFEQGA